MKQLLTGLFWLMAVNALAQPPNNAIFKGGNADGWDKAAYAQAGNNIFNGGNGDGWNVNAFAQNSNGIFKGGDGDGWSSNAFAQAGNSIYKGGDGDGWGNANFLQAGNNIYNGGIGDGWSFVTYLQAGNNIFTGGGGDGWASTYRALGALPVDWLSFTAEKKVTAALLKWETAKEVQSANFEIQRSNGLGAFETLGRVAAANNSNQTRSYSFTDQHPLSGVNYYRLKQTDQNGSEQYSPVRSVVFDWALQQLKAYPIPVHNLLTLELPDYLRGQAVRINVVNAAGVVLEQITAAQNRGSNTKQLDVSSWPAGVYTLQVVSQQGTSALVIVKY